MLSSSRVRSLRLEVLGSAVSLGFSRLVPSGQTDPRVDRRAGDQSRERAKRGQRDENEPAGGRARAWNFGSG